MLFYAKCVGDYNDKNGNKYYAFVTDLGDRVSAKASYCTAQPEIGKKCLLDVKAVHMPDKAFLAFDCKSVVG